MSRNRPRKQQAKLPCVDISYISGAENMQYDELCATVRAHLEWQARDNKVSNLGELTFGQMCEMVPLTLRRLLEDAYVKDRHSDIQQRYEKLRQRLAELDNALDAITQARSDLDCKEKQLDKEWHAANTEYEDTERELDNKQMKAFMGVFDGLSFVGLPKGNEFAVDDETTKRKRTRK